MNEIKSLNAIKAELKCHYGTEQFYKGMNPRSWYTEGIKDLLVKAACYWLYSIIETEVYDVLRGLNVPDTYYFQIVSENSKADLTLSDYQSEVLWERHIDFTTFPEGTMDLIVGWDGEKIITCLVSEN